MTPSTAPADRPPTGKAVLYCFDCDHESPIDGDWIVRRRGDCNVYRCPDCHTKIASRPRSSGRAVTGVTDRQPCIGD